MYLYQTDFVYTRLTDLQTDLLTQAGPLLEKFRSVKMPQFPFVVIPSTTTAWTLQNQSPFLFLAIMAASTEDNPVLQKTLDQQLKQRIGLNIIMNNERSMDLLLGLLVHIAWDHYRWETVHTEMFLLLQLAMTLVADLGLQTGGLTMKSISISAGCKAGRTSDELVASAEGKRAFLGVFYLCSLLSLFRPQLHMKHTDWIDHCCASLSENPEYPTDRILRTYIDSQSLKYTPEDTLPLEIQHPNHPHDALIDNWTHFFELKSRPVLLLGQLLERPSPSKIHLSTLIASTETFLVSFPTIPADRAVHLPLSFHTYVWYALLSLSKTLLLADAEWARSLGLEARVYDCAGAVMMRYEKLSSGEDFWSNSHRTIGKMVTWLKGQMTQRREAASQEIGHHGVDSATGFDDLGVDWDADLWQQTIEGSWFFPMFSPGRDS
ncbi:hypothetical protein EYZ11_006046 [Aspergillus tanneri]|uniref:Transcription factor domain-containing protein n=1 Tax=Aspergillus tanneri TaxID=1220188 RepID=A0A4S3JMF1_9EURO|nr:hypothetical protein EYZ11_006046 [Aspergillus tanneri]